MVGDAPVASSMIPATNTISANRLGARMSAQEPTRLAAPRGQELMAAEQQRGHHERQQVVDQPVADQRRAIAPDAPPWDREQDHRLEHADAARDVADQPAQIGEPEQANEGREAERQAGQQQDVETAASIQSSSDRTICAGRDGRSRHVQSPAGEPDR